MLLRFVVQTFDPDSGRRQGVFQAACELRERGELSNDEDQLLRSIGHWFDDNLSKPVRLSRKRNNSHRTPMALSWFKDTAQDHLRQIRLLSTVLEVHEIRVITLETDRPGYVVYEDDFQVVAEPFADTPT
jgi:hypothetical protein